MNTTENVSWSNIENLILSLSNQILKLPRSFSSITTLSRGGLIPSRLLADILDIKKIFSFISFEKPDFLQTTFEQINSLGNGFLPILFFAIIIITFYGFLDRFINQFKHQSS